VGAAAAQAALERATPLREQLQAPRLGLVWLLAPLAFPEIRSTTQGSAPGFSGGNSPLTHRRYTARGEFGGKSINPNEINYPFTKK
jgi:hypothetical protein